MVERKKKTVADFPELVAQWDVEKNSGLEPIDVTFKSHRKVWWKCPKGPDHEWQAVVSSRTKGNGLPSLR